MSEAEAGYTRRLAAAELQGKTVEEVEETQSRKILKEVKKRMQVANAVSKGFKGLQVPWCFAW